MKIFLFIIKSSLVKESGLHRLTPFSPIVYTVSRVVKQRTVPLFFPRLAFSENVNLNFPSEKSR